MYIQERGTPERGRVSRKEGHRKEAVYLGKRDAGKKPCIQTQGPGSFDLLDAR